ncbi:hypothetical protein ACFWD7_57390 [Streptomyces mirabilis]|uniref:hypothetical protein n=1 Tax=Streptomyces mirabilis TaxID=68239 RepID=UPI0021C1D0D7|nr:hypothetical protein [Streptomyces mirabilis]MCT9114328.1 hypothetical protein [Streptomyces mirabilis]
MFNRIAAQLPVIDFFDGPEPTRSRWAPGLRSIKWPDEIAYYLVYTPIGITNAQLARIAASRWAIEDASRPPRTSAAWRSARSPATSAGIGISPWRCSPTRSSPQWPCKSAKKKGGVEPDTPDLVYLTPAEIRRLLEPLNPAAILHAAPTR